MKFIIGLVSITILLAYCQVIECQYNMAKYAAIVLNDHTNDDAIRLNATQLITRSGFSYEEYFSIAEDGYITSILRLVNKKIKRSNLRKPPILIYHGANIDYTAYLIASSIQHHPEAYPRTAADGPITSSNRSLAFFLCNNGYDVFLVGSRASNKANMRYSTDPRVKQQIRNRDYSQINDPALYDYSKNVVAYFNFTQDEIIAYEMKYQMDLVLNVTNSTEMFLFTYSLSTPESLAFLLLNPEYARRTKVYFQLAPAIEAVHEPNFDKLYFEILCPTFPHAGIGFFPDYTTQYLLEETLIQLSTSDIAKYSIIYEIYSNIFGRSPIFLTNIERNVVAHLLFPTAFKVTQQYCQNSVSQDFTKFDYDADGNLRMYGQITPPSYNISSRVLEVQQYAVIYGTADDLASPATCEKLIAKIRTPNPVHRIIGQLYNHLDYIAAVDNDKQINEPILDLMNQYNN